MQERIRALVESGEMSGVADMSDLTDRRNGLRIVVTANAATVPRRSASSCSP